MISRRDVLSYLAMAGVATRFAPADLFAQAQTAAQRFGKDKLIIRSMRPPDFETPVSLLDSFITPVDRFYLRNHMPIPQIDAANALGTLIADLQKQRAALGKVIAKAEAMHDDAVKQAELLTSAGADAMAAVRKCCDGIELSVSDESWPLPKYREMLFPV